MDDSSDSFVAQRVNFIFSCVYKGPDPGFTHSLCRSVGGAISLANGGNHLPSFVFTKPPFDIPETFLKLNFKTFLNGWEGVEFLKALFALW